MNAQIGIDVLKKKASPAQFSCAACHAFDLNICQAVSEATWAFSRPKPLDITQSTLSVPARRIICREPDLYESVPIICSGWAASAIMLSDGSRQILSFLLPGDIVPTALIFDLRPNCFVEAVTDVQYRSFKRSELKDILFKNRDLMEKLSKTWIEEKARADQLIVDLGRRTADERIARLILNLTERLTRRKMVHCDPLEFDFPLRQHHIADATGLTPVHVSKVLSEFRRNGLIKISERALTILDPVGFRRVANKR